MNKKYNIEIYKKIAEKFRSLELFRPFRNDRYDANEKLTYDVESIVDNKKAKVNLTIKKFVGGGFAGQVYKIRVNKIIGTEIIGISENKIYAMKILIPVSNFSRIFRNFLYWIGFQAPFQLQVNHSAVKAGAIWQKFICHGAKLRFENENVVNNIHATFVDKNLGSCGEISDWVEGRTWKLEVDDRLDYLKKWQRGEKLDKKNLGSIEYRSKKQFMKSFVKYLHEIGAYEFARQYEWSTCKSQPNCLKLRKFDDNPEKGLIAVDFRAGLVLLPFLPMSPGDFILIFKGILRGSFVQFDRGNIKKLEAFIEKNKEHFSDMEDALCELKKNEKIYRNSIPDITHNHFKLFYSKKLWLTMLSSVRKSWQIQNLADEKFQLNNFLTFLLCIIGTIPLFGKFFIKFSCHKKWRKHYLKLISNAKYFRKAIQGIILEKTLKWCRAGRISNADNVTFFRFLLHLPFSFLPVGLHKFFTNWQYTKERLSYIFIRPIRLYFDKNLREQWLRDMILEGQKKQILSDNDAKIIQSQIDEPFIQKYLKSLAVHICTLPVTQIVSVMIAAIYIILHPEMPRAQAWGVGIGIIALFQIIPISPGSLVRGLYVLVLVIKEKDFKNYNIAVFLAFFKYIGYLAFPIQMTYHYPALARFMASHWATEAVHIVPVFGERGALLEHWVFNLFYNWPLTIRRKMQARIEFRKNLNPRYWHIPVISIVATGFLILPNFANIQILLTYKKIWFIIIIFFVGWKITIWSGGAEIWKRIISALSAGICIAILYTFANLFFINSGHFVWKNIAVPCIWKMFAFAILSTLSAIITELSLPEPGQK